MKHIEDGAIPKDDMRIGRGENVNDLFKVSPKISKFDHMPRMKENIKVSFMDPPSPATRREETKVDEEVLRPDIDFVLDKGQQSKVTCDPLDFTCLGFDAWVP